MFNQETKKNIMKPKEVTLETYVLFYESLHYYLSNFSAFQVRDKVGLVWMTAEHLYQAKKFLPDDYTAYVTDIPNIAFQINIATSAHAAKQKAKEYDKLKREDWSDIKLNVMEEILRMKVEQHVFVKDMLLSTGDKILVEDSPKDSFWGRGPDWKGQNHLGRLWMKIRDEIKEKESV